MRTIDRRRKIVRAAAAAADILRAPFRTKLLPARQRRVGRTPPKRPTLGEVPDRCRSVEGRDNASFSAGCSIFFRYFSLEEEARF